jgi:hypothetical protein
VDVEHVLRLLVRAAAAVDQELLDDEAGRVRYEQFHATAERYTHARARRDDPGRQEEQIEVPQLLGGDPRRRERGVRLPAARRPATAERGQELRVEAGVLVPEAVVGHRGSVVAQELLAEPCLLEGSTQVSRETSTGPEREVGIAREERLVRRRAGEGVEAVKPVRPAPDHDQVAQPGPKRLDETGEGGEVVHVTTLRR